jgi:aryl-alcohol dehydrogenase-like predicted oxidoreductase
MDRYGLVVRQTKEFFVDSRSLGRTDLQVSAFGMGCGNFGGIGSSPEFFGRGESEDQAFNLLDRAVDVGMNFLDTADAYGGGRSETMIGNWLHTRGGSIRDNLLISSKVGNAVGEELGRSGLSRCHVLRQIDETLGRLGLDHLDMYIVHEPDPATPLEETVGVFDELIRSGKVRHVGISNHPADVVATALEISEDVDG